MVNRLQTSIRTSISTRRLVRVTMLGAAMASAFAFAGSAEPVSAQFPQPDRLLPPSAGTPPSTGDLIQRAQEMIPQGSSRLAPVPPPPGGNGTGDFDQSDPTQVSPDMRRILEGEQEQQVQRQPPPPITVVGKVIDANSKGKALLRINQQYFLVEEGTRFSLPAGLEPIVYTVSSITAAGVEIQGGQDKGLRRLP